MELRERIQNAIDTMEKFKEEFHMSEKKYSDNENSKLSDYWLCITWQYNIDIERLRKLLFDAKYNRQLVTDKRINEITKRLENKYGVVL